MKTYAISYWILEEQRWIIDGEIVESDEWIPELFCCDGERAMAQFVVEYARLFHKGKAQELYVQVITTEADYSY